MVLYQPLSPILAAYVLYFSIANIYKCNKTEKTKPKLFLRKMPIIFINFDGINKCDELRTQCKSEFYIRIKKKEEFIQQ